MDGINGRCTFSASGRRLYRRDSRRFIFSTCPLLSSSKSGVVFRTGEVLCITGASCSGKTLMVMHAVADIISRYGMNECVIYLDIDLSFDLGVFQDILCFHIREHADLEVDIAKQVEDSLKRLIYIPVYGIQDLAVLLVSLDFYVQFSNVRILVVDSLPTKSVTNADAVVAYSFELLRRLHSKHKLFVIYTNREESECVIPLQVSTPHNKTSIASSNTPSQTVSDDQATIDSRTNILLFTIPTGWISGYGNIAGGSSGTLLQGNTNKAISRYSGEYLNDYLHIQSVDPFNSSTDGGILTPFNGANVMLCLLPCQGASIESTGYIGCILRQRTTDDNGRSYATATFEDGSRSRYSHVRRLISISSQIEQMERVDSSTDYQCRSDFDDIATQDLLKSENLMIEPTMEKESQRHVSKNGSSMESPLIHRKEAAMELDSLHTIRFALFRIHDDKSLRQESFSLHLWAGITDSNLPLTH